MITSAWAAVFSAAFGAVGGAAAAVSAYVVWEKRRDRKKRQQRDDIENRADRFNFTEHRGILDEHSGQLRNLENEVNAVRALQRSMQELLDSRRDWENEWTGKMRKQDRDIAQLQGVVLDLRTEEESRRAREKEGVKGAESSRSREEGYRHRRGFGDAKFE